MEYVKIYSFENSVGILRFSPDMPAPAATLVDAGKTVVIYTAFDEAAKSIQDKRTTLEVAGGERAPDVSPDIILSYGAAALVYKHMLTFGTGVSPAKSRDFRENVQAVIDHVSKTHKPDMDKLATATRHSFSYILGARL